MPTPLKSDLVEVDKSLETKREKSSETTMTVCSIKLELSVDRDLMTEIAGWPVELTNSLFTVGGEAVREVSLLLTKRELLVTDVTLTRKEPEDAQQDLTDPNKTPPSLHLPKGIMSDIRFVPLNSWMSRLKFKLMWKARGDEVEDLEGLLDTECSMQLEVQPAPRELKAQGGTVQPRNKVIKERPANAGDLDESGKPKAKRTRKKTGKDAAAEGGEKNDEAAPPTDGATTDAAPASPSDPAPEGTPALPLAATPPNLQVVGPGFKADAEQLAQRRPRRDPPPRKH
jgi:hypothetical protein